MCTSATSQLVRSASQALVTTSSCSRRHMVSQLRRAAINAGVLGAWRDATRSVVEAVSASSSVTEASSRYSHVPSLLHECGCNMASLRLNSCTLHPCSQAFDKCLGGNQTDCSPFLVTFDSGCFAEEYSIGGLKALWAGSSALLSRGADAVSKKASCSPHIWQRKRQTLNVRNALLVMSCVSRNG